MLFCLIKINKLISKKWKDWQRPILSNWLTCSNKSSWSKLRTRAPTGPPVKLLIQRYSKSQVSGRKRAWKASQDQHLTWLHPDSWTRWPRPASLQAVKSTSTAVERTRSSECRLHYLQSKNRSTNKRTSRRRKARAQSSTRWSWTKTGHRSWPPSPPQRLIES